MFRKNVSGYPISVRLNLGAFHSQILSPVSSRNSFVRRVVRNRETGSSWHFSVIFNPVIHKIEEIHFSPSRMIKSAEIYKWASVKFMTQNGAKDTASRRYLAVNRPSRFFRKQVKLIETFFIKKKNRMWGLHNCKKLAHFAAY